MLAEELDASHLGLDVTSTVISGPFLPVGPTEALAGVQGLIAGLQAGALDNPPGLSAAQKNPNRPGGFVETRLERALLTDGSYPSLSDVDRRFIQRALSAKGSGGMHYRRIDIRMDHSGALAATGGKAAMEVKTWQ